MIHIRNQLLLDHLHCTSFDLGILINFHRRILNINVHFFFYIFPRLMFIQSNFMDIFPGKLYRWQLVLLDIIWRLILTRLLVHKNILVTFTLVMVVSTIEALLLLDKILEDLSMSDQCFLWRLDVF